MIDEKSDLKDQMKLLTLFVTEWFCTLSDHSVFEVSLISIGLKYFLISSVENVDAFSKHNYTCFSSISFDMNILHYVCD